MLNKSLMSNLVLFVCGILIGYTTCAFYNFEFNSNNGKKKKNKRNDHSELLTKDLFEYEINRVYSLLDSIHKQMSQQKRIKSSDFNDNLDEGTDDQVDFQTELFYDTIESWRDYPEFDYKEMKPRQPDDFIEIDQMFEDNSISRQSIYNHLKEQLEMYENDPEFLWRISKATHFYSKTISEQDPQKNGLNRKDLCYESFEFASKALKLDSNNPNCHKWYAISIGSLSEFVTIREKISNGIKFKEHLEIAMSLKDDDPTLYHLAGRFCMEMLSISWTERKIAKMIYGELPLVSYEDALQYFYKAYHLKPKWKENILYIVQILIQNKQHDQAKNFLFEGLELPVSDDEKAIQDKLLKIKDSIPI